MCEGVLWGCRFECGHNVGCHQSLRYSEPREIWVDVYQQEGLAGCVGWVGTLGLDESLTELVG